MRKLSATPGYARFRLGLGVMFVLLGAVIAYRTIAIAGLRWEDMPALVLSAALAILGVIRVQQSLDVLKAAKR